MNSAPHRVKVLLVEDNAADVLLVEEAMQEAGVNAELTVAIDGEAALAALTGSERLAAEALPQLVLLDLNLPRVSGWDVMTTIRSDRAVRHIPILVLSTSSSRADINRAYRSGASCYVVKPMDFGDFVQAIRATAEFWFRTTALPTADDATHDRHGGAT